MTLKLIPRQVLLPPGSGIPGTPKNLMALLDSTPQVEDGIQYLISGGWAVEMLTGKPRKHKDIDVIQIDEYCDLPDTDNMWPDDYFGIIETTAEELLSGHSEEVEWEGRRVHVTSPEFCTITKLAPYRGQSARGKDISDIANVMEARPVELMGLYRVLEMVPGIQNPETYAALLKELQEQHLSRSNLERALGVISRSITKEVGQTLYE